MNRVVPHPVPKISNQVSILPILGKLTPLPSLTGTQQNELFGDARKENRDSNDYSSSHIQSREGRVENTKRQTGQETETIELLYMLKHEVESLKSENERLKEDLRKENECRIKVENELQEAKGQIGILRAKFEPQAIRDTYARFERVFANLQLHYEAFLNSSNQIEASSNVETDKFLANLGIKQEREIEGKGSDLIAIDFTSELLAAMDDFPHDRILHSRICAALSKMAKTSVAAATRIVLEGGLKLILKYAERHSDFAAMQENTCELINTLSRNNRMLFELVLTH